MSRPLRFYFPKMRKYNVRALMAFGHDCVAAILAWCLAYWFRFNLSIPTYYFEEMIKTAIWIAPLQALVFWKFGLYRGLWRYASVSDLKRILVSVSIAGMIAPFVLFVSQSQHMLPRSVLLLDPILLVMVMAGSRFAYRAWKEYRLYGPVRMQGEPVLILGAGDTAISLVQELSRSQEWKVMGLLDDNPAKHGGLIHGTRVLGRLNELPTFAGKLEVRHAIIALPSASSRVRRRAVKICSSAGIKVMTVPSFDDLMSGKVTVSQVRKVELEDLLGREPVTLDDAGLQSFLGGSIVMVTGAGGSIGSELCRQIAKYRPRELVLFELSEFALYRMEQEFKENFPNIPIVCATGDVKNRKRLDQIISRYTPSVIFHAAAYKHVPLMENDNAWEAVQNNVLGTYTVAQAAIAHNIAKFVFVSTDKAVNPTNVMGASKRLAEMVCQGLQEEAVTRFVMVRFGNVLGSNGSVIQKFNEQIAKSGPLTVTHPDITRYFMSIPEAAQLVLQAGLMGRGGEIFVMDMGSPVKIVDLARDMIKLSGFTEDEIRIVYSGLRPGEKLFEELLADDEHTLATPHPKLRIARARPVDKRWLDKFLGWLLQDRTLEDTEVKWGLEQWVAEYASEVSNSKDALEEPEVNMQFSLTPNSSAGLN